MKVYLKAGAQVDFLSPEEFEDRFKAGLDAYRNLVRQEEGETMVRQGPTFVTDATGGTSTLGGGGGVIWQIPVGFDFFVTRLTVDYEGSTDKTPTSCDVRLCADQNTPASLRVLGAQVPFVYEGSKSHAPMFRGGQSLLVALTSGPATTTIYCGVQGVLTQRRYVPFDIEAQKGVQ